MSGLPALPDKAMLIERVGPHREHWANSPRPERVEPVGPDEESVWDYPRPPEVRPIRSELTVLHEGDCLARSTSALLIAETAGAPVPYFPPDDVRVECLVATDLVTICEWKGAAVHFDFVTASIRIPHAAFTYPDPLDDLEQGYGRIAGYFGFYPAKFDCFVDDERVLPQPGNVYAGWVTSRIKGPIKGGPGTQGW